MTRKGILRTRQSYCLYLDFLKATDFSAVVIEMQSRCTANASMIGDRGRKLLGYMGCHCKYRSLSRCESETIPTVALVVGMDVIVSSSK